MKNTINITSAFAEIKDLEELGWEFGDLYKSIQRAQGISEEEAEEYAHENLFVSIDVREDGSTYYTVRDNNNDFGGTDETGDDEQTVKDLAALHAAGKIWNVETA